MNKGPESSIGYHTKLESLGIPQDALDEGVRDWQDYDEYLKEQAARPEETIIEEAKKPLELGDTPLDDDKDLSDIPQEFLDKAAEYYEENPAAVTGEGLEASIIMQAKVMQRHAENVERYKQAEAEKAKEANNITNVTKPETKEKKTWFSRFKKSKFGKAVIAGAATFITLGIGKIIYDNVPQSDNNNDRIEEAQKTPSSDTEKDEQEKNPLIGEELDNNEAEGVKFENLYYSTMDKKQYSQDLVGNIDGGIFNDAESFKKNIAEVHTNIGKGGVEASIAEHLGYDMSGLSANELGDQMENNLELREKVYNFIKDKYSRMENVKKVYNK